MLAETCYSGNPVVSDDNTGSLDWFTAPVAIASLYRGVGLEILGQWGLGYCWFYEYGGRFEKSAVEYGIRKSS